MSSGPTKAAAHLTLFRRHPHYRQGLGFPTILRVQTLISCRALCSPFQTCCSVYLRRLRLAASASQHVDDAQVPEVSASKVLSLVIVGEFHTNLLQAAERGRPSDKQLLRVGLWQSLKEALISIESH